MIPVGGDSIDNAVVVATGIAVLVGGEGWERFPERICMCWLCLCAAMRTKEDWVVLSHEYPVGRNIFFSNADVSNDCNRQLRVQVLLFPATFIGSRYTRSALSGTVLKSNNQVPHHCDVQPACQ